MQRLSVCFRELREPPAAQPPTRKPWTGCAFVLADDECNRAGVLSGSAVLLPTGRCAERLGAAGTSVVRASYSGFVGDAELLHEFM